MRTYFSSICCLLLLLGVAGCGETGKEPAKSVAQSTESGEFDQSHDEPGRC